jgi:hypothetical protein
MTVKGWLYDNQSNLPLDGANVIVVDQTGKPLTGSTQADQNGFFAITSDLLDKGAELMVGSLGYQSIITDPSVFYYGGKLGLDQSNVAGTAATLGPVSTPVPWGLIGVGAAGVALLAFTGKKKSRSVGKVEDWLPKLLVPAAIIGGGYLLYKKISSSTTTGTSANNTITDTNTAATAAADVAKAQATAAASGTAAQTLSDSTINTLADTLNQQLQQIISFNNTPTSDQMMAIRNNVISVNTATDWYKLVQVFGSRKFNTGGSQSLCSWFAINCDSLDLGTALKMALDQSNLSIIDSFFAGQSIPVVL